MGYCFNPICPNPQNPEKHRFCQTCGNRLLLGDRYRAVQPIGQGGSSKTFLGLDTHQIVKPRCLIKAFASEGTADEAAEKFRREVAQLDVLGQHPQIPNLFAYFERGQTQYLVQEFVEGRNLSQQLQEEGTFSEVQIRELLQDVLPLLRFLHEHRVIHRDIKPRNLIRPSGAAFLVLVDFGSAKHHAQTTLAKSGTVIGSAEYAAPEQLIGQTTFASDLYSLGLTCIHLLTGLSPFELYNQLEGTWMWRSVSGSVSPELEQILDQLLQTSLNQRYTSAEAVLRDLAQGDAAIAPPKSTRSSPVTKPVPQQTAIQADWSCQTTLTAPTPSAINGIAFSPDGTTLAAGCNDRTVRLWNLSDGACQTLTGHDHAVSAVAFSPDGKFLVTASWDATLRIWDLSRQPPTSRALVGHAQVVTAIALSPDGILLVSGSRDRTLKLWRFPDGALLETFEGHPASVESITIGTNGQFLASGCADGAVQIWHLGTKEHLRTLARHAGAVRAIAICPDNQTLVSAGWDTALKLRKLKSGGILHHLTGHLLPISSVSVRSDGILLATGSHDTTVKLWNLATGERVQTLSQHTGPVETVTFSPDGTLLASAGQDGIVNIWE